MVSAAVKENVKKETEKLKAKGIVPGLAVILVGDDPASRVYVNNKKKACEFVGFKSEEFELPLPKGLDENAVIEAISPLKDVDAFHKQNVGRIMLGDYDFLPCTPAGIMEMLSAYDISVDGKKCVVIGRSNIVGKPMAMLLLHENGTVTICHSHTKDLKEITSEADILVAAIGKAKFVTGMNRDEKGKLCGDVDFDNVKDKCSYITPVPGGVGPMTIATLMKNTLKAAKLQNNI